MIAQRLSEYARTLERAETTVFRVRAYRQAALAVQAEARSLLELYEAGGRAALAELPSIGGHIAYTIEGLLQDGTFRTLRPADAHVDPDNLLTSLPGIGPWLALRLRERLGVETVDELDEAVRAGRLEEVGLGPVRSQAVHEALAEHRQRLGLLPFAGTEPSVTDLLAVDAAFREHAARHETGSKMDGCWLPPFRTERNGWRFRARFARNSLAMRTDPAHQRVEVHFESADRSGQRQVVTLLRGVQAGGRVVRGRERECRKVSNPLSDSGRAG
jgi:hypothetical protein